MQKYSSAELRSFKNHYIDLLKDIKNLNELSGRLFSAGLLSHYILEVIRSLQEPQQIVKLLDTVEIQISLDPLMFYKFVDKLEEYSPTQHLSDKLRSTCGKCDNVHVCLSTSTDQWCSGVAQLKSRYMDSAVSSVIVPRPIKNTSGEQRMCIIIFGVTIIVILFNCRLPSSSTCW